MTLAWTRIHKLVSQGSDPVECLRSLGQKFCDATEKFFVEALKALHMNTQCQTRQTEGSDLTLGAEDHTMLAQNRMRILVSLVSNAIVVREEEAVNTLRKEVAAVRLERDQ